MIDIRCMTYDDIDFAKSLTDFEKWGYTRDDFIRLINLSPYGCFVAGDSKRPAGIITSIKYNDSAFLGTLIVSPQFRGEKIGESLIVHAIDYLKQEKIATIELDGVFPAVPLYRRLNFHDKFLSFRLFRPGLKKDFSLNRKETTVSCEEIINLDKELTGRDHGRLLNHYYQEFKDRLYAIGENILAGYSFVRPISDGGFLIGPFVARNVNAAQSILMQILEDYDSIYLSVGVPGINIEAIQIFSEAGFLNSNPSLRMYYGPRVNSEEFSFAIMSPDKG